MSTILINVTSLLLALDCASLAFIVWQGRRFLRTTKIITSAEDFSDYRELVTRCMKATFIFISLLLFACLLSAVGVVTGWMHVPDLIPVLLMGSIRVLGGAFFPLEIETRLKNIPTAGPHWHALQQRIVQLWDAEPWPNKIYSVGPDPAVPMEDYDEQPVLAAEAEH